MTLELTKNECTMFARKPFCQLRIILFNAAKSGFIIIIFRSGYLKQSFLLKHPEHENYVNLNTKLYYQMPSLCSMPDRFPLLELFLKMHG